MKRFLFVALLFASPVCATPTQTTLTQTWPLAPKGDIRVLVRQAMAQAQRNGPADMGKAQEVAMRSAEALPLLEPYSHSNNDGVRWAVLTIAEESHSPRALRLLSNVLARPEQLEKSNVGKDVLDAITSYNQSELRRWGGLTLQRRLMLVAKRDDSFYYVEGSSAVYLLPSFSGTRTMAFLRWLSHQPAPMIEVPKGFPPLAPRPFAANVMLAEMGDSAALQQLKAQLAKNKTNERVWLCQALPFVQNKTLLVLMPVLLDDERPVQEREMYVMQKQGDKLVCIPKILLPLRMCDVAMNALYQNIDKQGWRAYSDSQRATPAEIAGMRLRLALRIRQ